MTAVKSRLVQCCYSHLLYMEFRNKCSQFIELFDEVPVMPGYSYTTDIRPTTTDTPLRYDQGKTKSASSRFSALAETEETSSKLADL